MSSSKELAFDGHDTPLILKAVSALVADPQKLKNDAQKLIFKVKATNPGASDREVRKKCTDKIISQYSYYAAAGGVGAALPSVIPGIGQVASIAGGAAADVALSMKFQIEMVMELATVYGHDISEIEGQRLCYLIAGLGAVGQATSQGANKMASSAFIRVVNENLKGATLTAVKEAFKTIGVQFTKKGLVKAIPFGVGALVGGALNKGLTMYVGSKAVDFFEAEIKSIKNQPQQPPEIVVN